MSVSFPADGSVRPVALPINPHGEDCSVVKDQQGQLGEIPGNLVRNKCENVFGESGE
jgi:hypothetical protein